VASNVGQQQISVKYHDPVNSDIVNQRFFNIRPVGIVKGGYVTYSGSSPSIDISPLVCEIKDRGGDTNQIRMETTISVSLSMAASTPYAVLRWDHELSASTDYVTIAAVTTPEETDLVIGKASFTGANVSGFSYEERTFANDRSSFLKVTPIYPTASATSVRIMQGLIMTSTAAGYILVDEQTLDLSSVAGTTLYIYVDTTGAVRATATKLLAARNILLAKVTKDGSTITEKDIQDLRGFLTGPILVDDATIQKNDNNQLKVIDDVFVTMTDDETVAGTKTFTSSPLVPTATAGDSSAKAASTAFVQNAVNNADSYWTVTIADANNYTTPAQFVTSIASFSLPSRGSIFISTRPFNANSALFTMRVYCKTTTTKTLNLFSVNDHAYFYQDSTLVGSVGSPRASNTPYTITYNFVAGNTYTVQVVFADHGEDYYLSVVGDLIDNVNTFYRIV
jgi:hypothetical protein